MLASALPGSPAPLWIGRSNGGDTIVLLPDEAAVRSAAPLAPGLAALGGRGVVLTAQAEAGSGVDFVSRAFFPLLLAGVGEDPVTGSAHCSLAPFWAPRLGKEAMLGAQLSARGGRVACKLAGARVVLSGTAVVVMQGQLSMDL